MSKARTGDVLQPDRYKVYFAGDWDRECIALRMVADNYLLFDIVFADGRSHVIRELVVQRHGKESRRSFHALEMEGYRPVRYWYHRKNWDDGSSLPRDLQMKIACSSTKGMVQRFQKAEAGTLRWWNESSMLREELLLFGWPDREAVLRGEVLQRKGLWIGCLEAEKTRDAPSPASMSK